MATGRSRKSSSRLKKGLKRREESRRQFARRNLRVENLEQRQLLAVGPQVIGVQPNQSDLLEDGDIRNVAPPELTFQFNEGQVIDATTLDAIQITASGSDHEFDAAAARTDFNTNGAVVVQFTAKNPGPNGNEISLLFSKRDMGGPAAPTVSVDGKTIFVELNTNRRNETTAGTLENVLNAHVEARELVVAEVVFGPTSTDIATPGITYSPVDLHGANAASVTTDFNTAARLEVTFTAVATGPAANGFRIEVTKSDQGGAGDPIIEVTDTRTIHIDLNSNADAPTTVEQLVSAFNANAEARALVFAENPVGDPSTDIASPSIDYSPLTLSGASDIDIVPGYVGLGTSPREVVFRFAEPLPDDLYRVDIQGVGSAPLRNDLGIPLGDETDDGIDDGQDFALQFELDLGPQILGVVPQPITKSSGILGQEQSRIDVYFNDDDLNPVTATDPNFYQLIFTNETVDTSDDVVYKPIAVQYSTLTDRARLIFAAPLHQLGSGAGTFRLRVGTNEEAPAPPTELDLSTDDVGSSFESAADLDAMLGGDSLTGSVIVSSEIDPQVYELELPGSNDEPGHRAIPEHIETHLIQTADPDSGISTIFYNFRDDYGKDPSGNWLSNLISPEQKERAREIFEIFGQALGVQFVETATQGITVVTGDLRALDPEVDTGPGGVIGLSGASPITGQPTVIMDNAEDWYDAFGASDDPLRPESWFETAMHEVGHQLGLGHTYELPPGTLMGHDPSLGVTSEEIYPGDHDIVHGQHLYRTDGMDVDLYRFTLKEPGLFAAETIAERQADSSLLDSVIRLYRVEDGSGELVARNDDYFSEDSFMELALEPGEYFIGVSAAGNEAYDPSIEDSGFGGVSEGKYDLRLTFRPDAFNAILDVDNVENDEAGDLSKFTPLDGDGDGVPGGVFNFWFRVDPTPIFVDKSAPPNGSGKLTSPFVNIDDALAVARPGDVVRIVGNGGEDGDLSTPDDALPYEIGFNLASRPLEDGSTMDIPRGVTVMVDQGVVFKLRRARIGVGSASHTEDRNSGAFQVLGTPRLVDSAGRVVNDEEGNQIPGSVYFTSLNDESLGGDSNLSVSTTPQAGEWGGIAFRSDLDRAVGRFDWEREGIFLNYVNQADIRYGGGVVIVDSVPQTINPIHVTDTRPTITFNAITQSADAAISANPDSFEETNFHGPEHQAVAFTSDYSRIGPHVRGNRLLDNSVNGMFLRSQTPSGDQLEQLTVSGRLDDTDVVHVISETLRIQGSPGGPVQNLDAPDTDLVTLTKRPGGDVPVGIVDYKLTFVDADGNEGPISDPTASVLVDYTNLDTGETSSVLLQELPQAPAPYVARRLYRSVKSEYVLVAELNTADRSYVDDGTTLGGLLQGSTLDLTARLHGSLVVDPATIVKLNGAGIETGFGAQLIAEGVDGREVVFTSLYDDRYGRGGTFETTEQDTVSPGNWTGLYIGHTSNVSIDHAVIAYGGGVAEIPGSFAGFNALEIHQAEARVTNSLLEDNAVGVGGQATANRDGRGSNEEALVFVRGAQPIIMGNTIVRNAGPAINIDVNSLNHELKTDYGRSTGPVAAMDQILDNQGPLIRENRLGRNEINGMQVRGGTLTTEGVWDDTDIVHVVTEEITVTNYHTYGGLRLESSASESLVVKSLGVDAGFTADGKPLDIEDRIGGTIQVVGTAGHPVVLSSIYDCGASAGFTPDGLPQNNTVRGTCTVGESAPFADVVVVMDESASMAFAQVFSVDLINALEASLTVGGIGAGPAGGNRYGLVGFGGGGFIDDHETPHSHLMAGGSLWGTAADYAVAAQSLEESGAIEDGWWAIDYTTDTYIPRPEAAKFVILVTNEDRDVLEPTLTFTGVLDGLQDAGYILQGIVAAWLEDGAGTQALALDQDGTAYLADGLGGFTTSPGGSVLFASGTTQTDYIDMVFATGGIVGDISQIQLGGLTASSFSQAMITSIITQIGGRATPGDWRSVELLQNAHDRNVRVATELETGNATIVGVNEDTENAQFLGSLAPHEKAADDNRRLGLEVHGTLNRRDDQDVYSFDGVAGTEVWLDIDRTTYALDTVVELLDRDGNVLARSDDSGAEAGDPSLLYYDPAEMDGTDVNPLAKSAADSRDLWTTNPRDAGMRVILPGPEGTTNTYHVRVRSSSDDLDDLNGGLSKGVYQLQVRLRELDEIAGSSIEMADIRYATNGIEVSGLPAHSPLTGEAAEIVDATGADNNDTQATADDLGNLLNTDRGALSVAGNIAAADDVDWYQFEVRYDAIQSVGSNDPRHLSTVFDIDYADGFARANTNLWVFDDQGQLVLIGRDSNTPEDRPAGTDASLDDLTRGSVGALDPFIGAVELPAEGFAPGVYYVAVSSNAQLPDQLDQFLTPAATNPFVRLEPINSVNRIAEDHVDSPGNYATANAPQVPLLFGRDDEVSLFVPGGTEIGDGESVTITNASGGTMTYEFDSDGSVLDGNVAVSYGFGYSPTEMGDALAQAISDNPPPAVDFFNAPTPTPGNPTVVTFLSALSLGNGQVALTESVLVDTLLNEVTTADFLTGQLTVEPITRTTTHQQEPTVRQSAAPGESDPTIFVSRPGAVPYNLGDVTLFVSDVGFLGDNSTELLSVDPFTGQIETRVGAFGTHVGDIAMDPRGSIAGGGLFAYGIPETGTVDDTTTDDYWQIDPGTLTDPTTGANLGAQIGDAGIETYQEDPANPGAEIRSGAKNGVGVIFHALTFSNEDVDNQVRGFAVGTRGDTFVDPITGEVTSTALGIPNPANILFEFQPNSGTAINAPGTGDRKGPAVLTAGGTQIVDRGALDTTVDAFPAGGANNTIITGVDATRVDTVTGTTLVNIEDGDVFEVDQDGDLVGDITFEFDTGPEFFMTVAANVYLVDGDTFIVDGTQFEFDTGSVLIVTAQNGSQLNDGDTITITDNAPTPSTITFEFDNDNNTTGNTAIPFNSASNQQSIISSIIGAINSVGNFGVTAQQLTGTNRITLLNESTVSGVAINAAGVNAGGTAPGVGPASIGIQVEETFTEDAIGAAIQGVIDGTQGQPFRAGATGDRVNFMGALTASFAGVTNPVFTPGGVAGTIGQFNLPVPFLASDNSAAIATRVHQAIVGAGFDATLSGATVFLDPATPPDPQSTFVCTSQGTPPMIGAPGVQDCPLQSGGVAPGGQITGVAFVGPQMYAVTDTGGLFRVTDSTGYGFDPDSPFNVADYVDGSRELLTEVNEVTRFLLDPLTGELAETTANEPIRFAGLVAGPQNTENGLYENLLFGITDEGRLFAFDTFGEPQAVFANGTYFADTYLSANGLALGTLDDNLWHVSDNRDTDLGHGSTSSFDGNRVEENQTGNTSFYFGYEGPTVQEQFGDNAFAPATPQYTYDFPGGAHGTLESNAFSLEGYSPADKPTLYFNYFLETEQADAASDTTLDDLDQRMRDALRVYIAGDDGHWRLLSTNNSDRDPLDSDWADEFDPFPRLDPVTGQFVPEQPFDRAETFDGTGDWRQARIDLAPYAGQSNLRLRFDFSTAAGMSSGGRDWTLDLNTGGNELRAIPGAELRDGDMFTISGLSLNPATDLYEYATVAGFEFNMGPTIVAPTGAAIRDGDLFDLDGTIYEFDDDDSVGVTDSKPHVPIPFVGTETAGELAVSIQDVLISNPPDPIELLGDLAASEPNDTLDTAYDTGLDGTTQTFQGTGNIGNNFDLVDLTMDVDMVQLHLDAGDSVLVTTNTARLSTQLDTYLRLFDEDGNELDANDNADPTNAFSRDSKIEFAATERGTYYVGITAAHNTTYDPNAAASGTPDGVPSQGFYEFTIAVTDPVGPQRVGNRLNLPNAGKIVPSLGLPDTFAEGSGDTRSGLPNPFADADPTLPDLPVHSVRVHSGMSRLAVADAIRVALADHLGDGNGSVNAVKARNEAVQLVGYGVDDAGPLGLSGPSDPSTAIPGSGLFGDLFGAFNASAEFDGQTNTSNPGALRMQDNQYEGVYVDDVVIGFAARGEMVTAPDNSPAVVGGFLANNNQPDTDIDRGAYQLEIRQATEYGLPDASPEPTLILYDGFDVNDRLADGITLAAASGDLYRDGQTFSINDGDNLVTFEFDDRTVVNGVEAGNERIAFDPSDTDAIVARRIRDAVNAAADQGKLDAKATSSDGVVVGAASTSNLVHLYGDLTVSLGLVGGGPLGNVPVAEGNDTLQDAVVTGIVGEGRQDFRATGVIGDNPNIDPFAADVDLFRIDLNAGEAIVVDIDASELGSPLDSLVRVFDGDGNPLTVSDDQGVEHPIESDDDLAPGEDFLLLPELAINRDSFLGFIAPADGDYYVGVSGFGNEEYDATDEGSGRAGSTGWYVINIQRPDVSNGLDLLRHAGKGDQNLERDQGQVLITSSHIRHSLQYGITVDAGQRSQGDAPKPGPVRNLSQINTAQLAPGVTITNNVITTNNLGGIRLSGDPGDVSGLGEQPAPVPFARIINNTVVGRATGEGTTFTDIGIEIADNVSPTVLNNVLSSLGTGISVDPTSTSTVLGGTLYHNNGQDSSGVGLGDFSLVVDPATQLFVNPEAGNYYPAANSPVIDSSIDSLEDRPQMVQIQDPLGIERSPILAPEYDARGQLRVDDPSVVPPPGMGENVYKDRGGLDRADFHGPTGKIISPLDNGGDDHDPSESRVSLFGTTVDEFSIQLIDKTAVIDGIGIDDATITEGVVRVTRDGELLTEGIDYEFDYDATNDIIRLTPLSGVWQQERGYVIEVASDDRFVVRGLSGDMIAEGDSFDIVDELGNTVTFEYDTGYVIYVPQTLALQIPRGGGGAGGVQDGDTITVQQDNDLVTIELDNNGVTIDGNVVVTFTDDSSQGEIADAIVVELANAGLDLTPTNMGDGLVHLGVDGSQTLSVVSTTILQLGVEAGVKEGESFTIDDGGQVITFEFSQSPSVSQGNVAVSFSYADTHEEIAKSIELAINGTSLGLATQAISDGRVQVGGSLNHQVDVSDATLLLTGEPGATLAWGLRIPTTAGSFQDLVNDGETFTITNGGGFSVTFELDSDQEITPGNTAIPFTLTTTTTQLANTIVSRVRNAKLGLFPFNAGNGIVTLGGNLAYSMDVTATSLTEVGQPGVPAATPIRFTPDESFTAEEVAQVTADAINDRHLSGVTATADGDLTVITGADDVVGTYADFLSGAKDLAGNPLRGNQPDGRTVFTIFIGTSSGMDYGDAPATYPTLRADDGARHLFVEGFHLGALIDVNADGIPTQSADGDDLDGDDEDGIVFDAATPLVPNRFFNVTVTTAGIGDDIDDVSNFGVLDAWIDFNRDGDWDDANEQILANTLLNESVLTDGVITIRDLVVPANAIPGDTYARFRLSTQVNLTPYGEADAGEVEDYLVTIETNPWQNSPNRFDVSNDGWVSPVDALLLINHINSNPGDSNLPIPKPTNAPFLDVSGDGAISAIDVLQEITELNRLNAVPAGGEGEAGHVPASSLARGGHLGEVLRGEENWLEIVPDVDEATGGSDARDAFFADLGV